MVGNQKTLMKDMVVILPGITGSVLQKDGEDLWNVSGSAIWQILKSLGDRLQKLKLEEDDPNVEDLGDGIKATQLVTDAHLIPGFWKIDGYTKTSRLITQNFEVIEGEIYKDSAEKAANFYHFPYDWRRDNRVSAKVLKRLLDQKLKTWREFSGHRNAKVILLAHSMGGLISRYYLEVLGGWQDCRALFTFGTPYRGSLNAVNFLANGYKNAFIDLTNVMRSLTSVYQLMPIYKVLQIGDESHRIAEVPNLPNIAQNKAKDALAFHREIEQAVKENQKAEKYHTHFATVPFVGVQQPTLQSAVLENNLTVSKALPAILSELSHLADGDGTVPLVSAFPIEFNERDVLEIPNFIAESHGSIQNQTAILLNLLHKLQIAQSSSGTVEDIRGRREESRTKSVLPGISLSLDDLYLKDEPIIVTAQVNPNNEAFDSLQAQIDSVSNEKLSVNLDFVYQNGEWMLKSEDLFLPGLYRIKVQTNSTRDDAPNAVHNLFEVADID